MKSELFKYLSTILGVALSAICLMLAASHVSWVDFRNAFSGVSLSWIAIASVLQIATVGLRAYRWKIMFRENVAYKKVFWAQAFGYLVNNLLPLRLGDIARIMLLRLMAAISALRIGFTIIMERFLDVLMTLILLLLIASTATISGDILAAAGVFLVGIVLILLGGFVFYRYGSRFLKIKAGSLFHNFLEEFRRTVDTIIRGRPVLGLSLSGGCLVLSTAIVWAVLNGFEPNTTIWTAMLVTVAITFAMAIPSAPANVGVFQFAGQFVLMSLPESRFSPAVALAAVTGIHAIHFFGTTLLGIISLWHLPRYIDKTVQIRDLFGKLFRTRS